MWRTIATIAGGVVLFGLALWLILIASIRTQFEPVLNFLRKMNRNLTNRMVIRKAGQPGAKSSIVRHTGRVSGTGYETPVDIVETEEGFVVALPYGARPDWLKNLMAAQSGQVVHRGQTYAVGHPRLVGPDEAEHFFSQKQQRVNRLYGLKKFLMMQSRILEGSEL